MRRILFVLFAVVVLTGPTSLGAQDVSPLVRPGDRVRILSPSFHGTGVYQAVSGDTVVVYADPGGIQHIPVASVARLERSLGRPGPGRSAGHGALVGGVGGALAGGLFVGMLLAIFCEPPSCTADDWVTGVGVGAGVGGAAGVVAGAVAGLAYAGVRGERWQDVPLPAGLGVSVRADRGVGIAFRVPR
jgi:hypothetical protein